MDKIPVCRRLFEAGSCTIPFCRFNHNVRLCTVCGSICKSDRTWQLHLAGFKHLNAQRARERARREPQNPSEPRPETTSCKLCGCLLYGPMVVSSHLRGRRHIENALAAGKSPSSRDDLHTVEMKWCDTCERDVPLNDFTFHCQGVQHRRMEGSKSLAAALREAEEDKNGITVAEGDVDFGIVPWDSHFAEDEPTRTVASREIFVRNTVPNSDVVLLDVRLASFPLFSSPFKMRSQVTRPVALDNVIRAIAIEFYPQHLGSFEERVTLLFEDRRLSQRFVVMRTLKAIVGDAADYEELRPSAPYVRPKWQARNDVGEVIPGEAPPALSSVKWVVPLPLAKIPLNLASILCLGSDREVEDKLRSTVLPRSFNADTYGAHFRVLLHAEEKKMEDDLQVYDMQDTTLTKDYPFYSVQVPGLAEKRPSVIVGDSILVQASSSSGSGKWFEGRVHRIRQLAVEMKFDSSFFALSGEKFSVRFELSRHPLRRMHQALSSAFKQPRILFPLDEHLKTINAPKSSFQSELRIVNRNIASNEHQLLAVAAIVKQPPGSVPFIVFGPPGTGKTVTIIEAIRQVLIWDPEAKILACAPSNSAADLLAERLLDLGPTVLLRLNAPSRPLDLIPTALRKFSSIENGHFTIPDLSALKRFRVIVSTCISASLPFAVGMPRGHFSHIFVDEAGQALEPEIMIPIKTMADNDTNVVLSGDPKQLGPIVRSSVAIKFGLGQSYLARLMELPLYNEKDYRGVSIVKLLKNWRSHPAILRFPNERFYKGDLECHADPLVTHSLLRSHALVKPDFPVVFHAIAGKDAREAQSPSFFNIGEVSLVKRYVQDLLGDQRLRLDPEQIGVISPYNAQCRRIRLSLSKIVRADRIKIGSVEEFQGQERRVIIISAVRSSLDFIKFDLKHTLGFVANPRRFNVAITRAQALLIVIGDPKVLSLDPLWRSFMNYIHTEGGWTGPVPDWDTSEGVSESASYDKQRRAKAEQEMTELEDLLKSLVITTSEDRAGGAEAAIDQPWRPDE
ncbi:P-loop containing nucleoside triphosphate hydrolase protein [Sistotremastrum niveocremeum HHB9708]|uniref:RNA helicase n=1 Tax=Sistotremastrum niveocremeum HHB9708 TaxID=1314777 RepID=A0A164YYP1_9AGAM|nr:P-loop containing nucleoside triphosphate hydrolase protein [Sistotremastrum niveocremeum HHB9708]